MNIYRICNRYEIDQIFNNEDFSNIGGLGIKYIQYKENKNINEHEYNPNKRYLHFFKSKDSIIYWNTLKDNYICTYNIPEYILDNHLKNGIYLNPFNFKKRVYIPEYAIESNKIKKDYLIKVEKIKEDIDICDDDYKELIDDYLEIIYENKSLKLIKTINNKQL